MSCGRYLTVSLRAGLPARLLWLEFKIQDVKAHKSLHDAADHFEKRCCRYNELADAAAKEAVKLSFAQLQALHSKQLQINKMVARFNSFLAECAALQLKAVQRQSQFETAVLDVRGSCFCHRWKLRSSIPFLTQKSLARLFVSGLSSNCGLSTMSMRTLPLPNCL